MTIACGPRRPTTSYGAQSAVAPELPARIEQVVLRARAAGRRRFTGRSRKVRARALRPEASGAGEAASASRP